MLYKKTGFPEDSEIVICTVNKVLYHAVAVTLDEYGRQGIIHISEVSPGRIRNIRDFVREGKKCICKVLRVNQERGHIDLSLRRVSEGQKREKNDLLKQEQKAEKIVESLAEKLKKPVNLLYDEIAAAVFKQYEMLCFCFNEVVESSLTLESLGLKKEIAEPLTSLIKEKIKPKEVLIGGELALKTYSEDGIHIIKDALQKAESAGEGIEIKYAGAGKYDFQVKAKTYKLAEDILKKATDAAIALMEKNGEAAFVRQER